MIGAPQTVEGPQTLAEWSRYLRNAAAVPKGDPRYERARAAMAFALKQITSLNENGSRADRAATAAESLDLGGGSAARIGAAKGVAGIGGAVALPALAAAAFGPPGWAVGGALALAGGAAGAESVKPLRKLFAQIQSWDHPGATPSPADIESQWRATTQAHPGMELIGELLPSLLALRLAYPGLKEGIKQAIVRRMAGKAESAAVGAATAKAVTAGATEAAGAPVWEEPAAYQSWKAAQGSVTRATHTALVDAGMPEQEAAQLLTRGLPAAAPADATAGSAVTAGNPLTLTADELATQAAGKQVTSQGQMAARNAFMQATARGASLEEAKQLAATVAARAREAAGGSSPLLEAARRMSLPGGGATMGGSIFSLLRQQPPQQPPQP